MSAGSCRCNVIPQFMAAACARLLTSRERRCGQSATRAASGDLPTGSAPDRKQFSSPGSHDLSATQESEILTQTRSTRGAAAQPARRRLVCKGKPRNIVCLSRRETLFVVISRATYSLDRTAYRNGKVK